MTAVEALKLARAAGVALSLDGDDLVLEAAVQPPEAVLDLLTRHKPGIVVLLRPGSDGWDAEDWQVFFDERAGIAEFDGGLLCVQAEAVAFACCVAEWLNRNFVCSPPGRCLGCGGDDHTHDPLLPFGIELTGYAWLHSRCWPFWYAGRKAEAVAALQARGIAAPAEVPDDWGKKTEAHDGRLWIGMTERLRARHGGSLPFDQREPAPPRGLAAAGLAAGNGHVTAQGLGGETGKAAPFPEKGMWRHTYERLREQAFAAEMLADNAFMLQAAPLLARIDN